jgi:hypothetical protein
MVLPAFALEGEVQRAVPYAGQRKRPAEPAGVLEGCPRAEQREQAQQGECRPAVAVVAHRLPHEGVADPRVEGNHVAGEDLDERREPAAPREPPEDERGPHEPRAQHQGHRPEGGPAEASSRHPGCHRAREPECRRVGLDRDPGAEAEAGPEQRGPCAAALEEAGGAVGPGQEEQAEQEIALANPPGAAGHVVEREEQAAGESRPAVGQPRPVDGHEPGGDGEPGQVEEPPGEVARAGGGQERGVEQMSPGQIHVEEVPVWDSAPRYEPGCVVHQRRVVDERPAERPPCEPAQQERASDQNRLQ